MSLHEIRVEMLLDRRVVDRDGRPVGRVEEILAERDRDGWVAREMLVGPLALLRRLALLRYYRVVRGRLPGGRGALGYRVTWDQIDLTGGKEIRLRCALSELRPLGPGERAGKRHRPWENPAKIGPD